jgi:hypothetical protein
MPRTDRSSIIAILATARLEAFAGFNREAGELSRFHAILGAKPRRTFAGIALAELTHRLAGGHGSGERDIEAAAAALHRNEKPRVRPVVDMVRHAGRFTAEEKYVPIRIGEIRVGQSGPGREEEQPASLASPPLLEAVEVDMPGKRRHFEIVHAGTPEIAVGEVEAGGLDDVDGDAEAGGHAQDGAGVAGDVGLVERDAEGSQGAHQDRRCTKATVVRRATAAGLSGVVFVAECDYSDAIVNSNQRRRIWNS